MFVTNMCRNCVLLVSFQLVFKAFLSLCVGTLNDLPLFPLQAAQQTVCCVDTEKQAEVFPGLCCLVHDRYNCNYNTLVMIEHEEYSCDMESAIPNFRNEFMYFLGSSEKKSAAHLFHCDFS